MKPSARSLLAAVIVALFFTLTLASFAEEKAAPPPPATPANPPAPAVTAETPPTPAAVAPAATPAPEAKRTFEVEPPLRSLSDSSAPVQKTDELDPNIKTKKKSRSQQIRERADEQRQRAVERRDAGYGDPIVNVFGDSYLEAGKKSDGVVAVFGSSTSEGEVADSVVAVFGDTRVTGPGAKGEVVTVFGGSYVDAPVGGEVVVVFGDLEFGPNAKVDGEVVCVGGKVTRHPDAVLKGGVKNVAAGKFTSLHAWFELCLRSMRPLALSPRVAWAWGLALAFLAAYIVAALLFRTGAEKCVKTLETSPGFCVLTALLATLILPVLIVLLVVTTVGVVAVPFVGIAVICAALFGKMVILAWLGRRFTGFLGEGPLGHVAFAVLVGGIIVLALYTVPVLGFLLFNFIGWLGLGVVVYTVAQNMKRSRPAPAAAYAAPAPAAAAAYTAPFAPPAQPAPAAVPPAPSVTASVPPSDGPLASAGFVGAAALPAAPVPEIPVSGAIPVDPGVVPPPIQPAPAPVTPPPMVPPMQSFHLPPPLRSTPIISASTLPRAGFWIRLAAMGIDGVLIAIITSIMLHSGPLFFVGLAGYAAAMWKYKGTTLGGIICGLKVVRLDDRPLDWPTSIVRALGCFLSMVMMGFGFIWVAFDREKQSWHDKIAGTTVVLMPKGVSLL